MMALRRGTALALVVLLAGCTGSAPSNEPSPSTHPQNLIPSSATQSEPPQQSPTPAAVALPKLASFTGFLGNLHAGGYGSIAAGDTVLLASSHDEIALHAKNGTLLERMTHNAFFRAVLPAGEGLSDPRVTYDTGAARFYAVAASGPMNGGCQAGAPECPNTWTMAVSRTASPASLDAADWRFWSFDATIVDGERTNLWGDFSAIAADNRILAINGQMGTHFPTTAAFDRILVYNKSDVLATDGSISPAREFHRLVDPGTGETLSGRILPALRMDAGDDGLYFVHYGLRNCDLTVAKITGPAENATLTLRTAEVPGTCFAWVPGEQPDDERPILIPPIITSPPIQRGHSIWVAETIPVDHPSGRVNGIRVVELDVGGWPDAPRIVDDDRFSVEGLHFANPALAVDAQGGVAVGFSVVGKSHLLSVYEAHRPAGAANFTEPRPVVLGTARIDYPRIGETVRFGGYSGASLDPQTGRVWIAASYVHEHCVWGIWIAEVDTTEGARQGKPTPAASPHVREGDPCPSIALSPYDGRPP